MEARLDRIKGELKKISAIEVSIEELKSEVRLQIHSFTQRMETLFLQQRTMMEGLPQIGEANRSKQPDQPELELFEGLPTVGTKTLDPLAPAPFPPVQNPSKSSPTMLFSHALYLFNSVLLSAISSTLLQFNTSKHFVSIFVNPSLLDVNAIDPTLVLLDDMSLAQSNALSMKSICHSADLNLRP
ncbi:hypothetical protein Scep_014008 [Stephania cephalantha]|uniref:Uncharacterized protein n=1 Tax=Stephania cephalantha TaxID=152367 RepID=A0AAP0J2G6_9MAGN